MVALLAGALAACGFAFEAKTDVGLEGDGSFTLAIGFLVDEDDEAEAGCEFETLPIPGATVREEVRDGATWCVMTAAFSDLEELRSMYETLFEEAASVECLAFREDELVYDLRLYSEGGSEGDGGAMPWQLTVPGRIGSHNADEVRGDTLIWWITDFVGEKALQLNLGPDGLCPTDLYLVQFNVWEDGTGTAILTVPTLPTGEDDTQLVIAELRQRGWTVSDPASGAINFAATRDWDSAAEFQSLAAAIPPLDGSDSEFNLDLQEDPDTGLLRFTFRGRVDLSSYVDYWQRINPQLETPPFRFDYIPAGTLDSVSGDWTDNILLEVFWTPESARTSVPVRAISVIEPLLEQEVDPATADANLDTIRSRFLDEIPTGQVQQDPSVLQRILMGVGASPGLANNMTNWTTWSCGDYQTRVLAWLDSIRTSSDPEVRAQLAGLDYGPVQAYRGGHQAVVVFPRGTDWQDSGTVLDPWPNQQPEIFSMDQWRDRFSWGHGIGESGNNYPHMFGNPSAYPGSTVPNSRLHTRRIGVNSPVGALVTADDGRRLGMLPDGEFVNEIEGADFYPFPGDPDHFQWYFGLPEGTYELALTGLAEGDTHVVVANESGEMVTYGPQEVAVGEAATLAVAGSITQPLELPDGRQIKAIPVTDNNVDQLEFGEPEAGTAVDPDLIDSTARIGYLLVLLLCTLGPAAGIWATISLRRGRTAG